MKYPKIVDLSMKNRKQIQIISICLLVIFVCTSLISAQDEDTFPVPESYKVEGIPKIKKSEVSKLFYDPKSIKSNLIWDADRKNRRLLVTDETNHIYLVDRPLESPDKIIEKIIPYRVRMNPNGKNFALMSDHEDEDNYQLYLFNIKQNTLKKLTKPQSKDESVNSFVWDKKGTSLFYSRVDYVQKSSKICRNDFKVEKCYSVKLNGIWDVIQQSNDKILLKFWKASSSQLLYVFNTKLNKLIPVDEKGNSRRSFIIDNTVFWTSDGNENCEKEPCILTMNLKKKAIKQLNIPNDVLSLSNVKISPKGNHLLIKETKNGINYLRIFKVQKNKIIKEIPSFISPSYTIWHSRWLSDDEIAYTLENVGKPASIQSFNIKTRKVTNWTKEKLPKQLENKVKPPKILKWKSFDLKEITGYIVRPQIAKKKTPVMIFVHGGPQILDKPIFNLQETILATHLGITIIHTNIRGSSGFGREFMDADNKEKRGDAIKDIQSLINWIEKQPDLDSSNIYLRGKSYGGFIVLSTALQEPKRVKGVIAEYPLVSIRGLLSQSWIDQSAKNEYGDPKNEELMSKLDALSPLNNTKRWNNIPLFLTRGKLDERNPESNVIDLKNQLQRKKSEVWFIYSTKSGHGVSGDYVTAAIYKFLKKQINKES